MGPMTNIKVIPACTLWDHRVHWFAQAGTSQQKLSKQAASLQSAAVGRQLTCGSRDLLDYPELWGAWRGSRMPGQVGGYWCLCRQESSRAPVTVLRTTGGFSSGQSCKITGTMPSGSVAGGWGRAPSDDLPHTHCWPTVQPPKLQEHPFPPACPSSALYWGSVVPCSL